MKCGTSGVARRISFLNTLESTNKKKFQQNSCLRLAEYRCFSFLKRNTLFVIESVDVKVHCECVRDFGRSPPHTRTIRTFATKLEIQKEIFALHKKNWRFRVRAVRTYKFLFLNFCGIVVCFRPMIVGRKLKPQCAANIQEK